MNLIKNLIVEINEQYRLSQDNYLKAQEYQSKALIHAKNCGELLIQAKKECQHGQWLTWLQTNTVIPIRTVQTYMKIALNWDIIDAEILADSDQVFGVNDARKILAQAKNVSETHLEKIKNLTKNEIKVLIFDSQERLKAQGKKLKALLIAISQKYGSLKQFLELDKSMDSDNQLTQEEKNEIHTKCIKLNLCQADMSGEEMRQLFLEQMLEMDYMDFEQWVKLEFKNLKYGMICELMLTDKSLINDLVFNYYDENELKNFLENCLNKN